MSDLASYFDRYRPSGKSGVTRVTEVTGAARYCNAPEFLPDDLSPGVTRVTDRPDAIPRQDTDGLVTVVTQVVLEPGDNAGQKEAVPNQQVTEPFTSVTHVTRQIDRGRTETTDPTRCAWCGEGERSGAMIVPFGTATTGHTWLHSACWREWYAKRGLQAEAALAAE